MSRPDRFLVTGAASGIGRCLTGELARRGHRVLATDLDDATLGDAAEAGGWPADRVRRRALDVRDPEGWEKALGDGWEAFSGLDVLLNVAGFLRPAEVTDATDADVHRHFDVNVKGVIFGTRAAARRMVEQGGGHVVNFASMASLAPIPGLALYSASKYAVRAFSLAAAEELRPAGVAVTAICPDAVQTPMLDLQLDYEEAALTFTAPRILTAEEVTRVTLGRVLTRRPLLVTLPRHRGWLARVADLFPFTARPIAGLLRRQGLRKQAALRRASGR